MEYSNPRFVFLNAMRNMPDMPGHTATMLDKIPKIFVTSPGHFKHDDAIDAVADRIHESRQPAFLNFATESIRRTVPMTEQMEMYGRAGYAIDRMIRKYPGIRLGVYAMETQRDWWTYVKANQALEKKDHKEFARRTNHINSINTSDGFARYAFNENAGYVADEWPIYDSLGLRHFRSPGFTPVGLTDRVAFSCPSVYSFYSDNENMRHYELYFRHQIMRARRNQKPVYPVFTPVHQSTGTVVAGPFFRKVIELCYAYADGMIIWTGSKEPANTYLNGQISSNEWVLTLINAFKETENGYIDLKEIESDKETNE